MEEDDELMAIQKSRSREIAQWRVDLIICIVFTVPLLLIKLFWTSSTTGTSDELSAAADETPGMGLFSNVQPQVWVMWLLASPVQFYVGKRFYQKAFYGLRAGCSMGMDFLVASGTSFAYGYSVVSVMVRWANDVSVCSVISSVRTFGSHRAHFYLFVVAYCTQGWMR